MLETSKRKLMINKITPDLFIVGRNLRTLMIYTLNALAFKYNPDVIKTRELLLFLEFYWTIL